MTEELYRARASCIGKQHPTLGKISVIHLYESDTLVASSDSLFYRGVGVSQIFVDENAWRVSFTPQRTGSYDFKAEIKDEFGRTLVEDFDFVVQESYNIVVLLTDDQHFDTLQYMPFVRDTFLPQSLNFTESFITIPVCCPARASLLSGFHGHNTGVLTNPLPNGSRNNFNEQDTMPLHLQQLGYNTGFIGKYLHGYTPGFVPPGWTSFVANNEGGQIADWFNLKDITIGSSSNKATRGRITRSVQQHLVSYHRDKATEFIDVFASARDPFFLYISTYAPHPPATPEAIDTSKYLDFNYSGRAFNEQDLTDKPNWVQAAHRDYGQCATKVRRDHIQSLQGVDRMMEDVWQSVASAGELDRTIFILTSDNGLTFGEHGLPCDKGMAYEESIRVPFVVRMPDGQVGTSDLLTAVNIDLATTVYDLVGIDKETDGLSLVPALQQQVSENEVLESWREHILIEAYGYLDWRYDTQGVWSGIRSKDWKYVETADDINELYNLKEDPFEQENLIASGDYLNVIDDMRSLLTQQRGLAITTFDLPDAERGQPYDVQLTAWGASEPYTWVVSSGRLPNGLRLNSRTGVISGNAASRGTHKFQVRVTSPKQATHRGKNQQFFFEYELRVQ